MQPLFPCGGAGTTREGAPRCMQRKPRKVRAGNELFAGRGIDHLTCSGGAIDTAWRRVTCHNEGKSDQEYRTTTGFVNAPRSGHRHDNVYNIINEEVKALGLVRPAILKIYYFVAYPLSLTNSQRHKKPHQFITFPSTKAKSVTKN